MYQIHPVEGLGVEHRHKGAPVAEPGNVIDGVAGLQAEGVSYAGIPDLLQSRYQRGGVVGLDVANDEEVGVPLGIAGGGSEGIDLRPLFPVTHLVIVGGVGLEARQLHRIDAHGVTGFALGKGQQLGGARHGLGVRHGVLVRGIADQRLILAVCNGGHPGDVAGGIGILGGCILHAEGHTVSVRCRLADHHGSVPGTAAGGILGIDGLAAGLGKFVAYHAVCIGGAQQVLPAVDANPCGGFPTGVRHGKLRVKAHDGLSRLHGIGCRQGNTLFRFGEGSRTRRRGIGALGHGIPEHVALLGVFRNGHRQRSQHVAVFRRLLVHGHMDLHQLLFLIQGLGGGIAAAATDLRPLEIGLGQPDGHIRRFHRHGVLVDDVQLIDAADGGSRLLGRYAHYGVGSDSVIHGEAADHFRQVAVIILHRHLDGVGTVGQRQGRGDEIASIDGAIPGILPAVHIDVDASYIDAGSELVGELMVGIEHLKAHASVADGGGFLRQLGLAVEFSDAGDLRLVDVIGVGTVDKLNVVDEDGTRPLDIVLGRNHAHRIAAVYINRHLQGRNIRFHPHPALSGKIVQGLQYIAVLVVSVVLAIGTCALGHGIALVERDRAVGFQLVVACQGRSALLRGAGGHDHLQNRRIALALLRHVDPQADLGGLRRIYIQVAGITEVGHSHVRFLNSGKIIGQFKGVFSETDPGIIVLRILIGTDNAGPIECHALGADVPHPQPVFLNGH